MLNFILFMCFIAFLVFFPYKKVYLWLRYYVDVKLLLGAVLLIHIRFICGWVRHNFDELGITPAGYTKALYSFTDVLGWIFMVAGVILLFVVIREAIKTKKDKERKLTVNGKNEEGDIKS